MKLEQVRQVGSAQSWGGVRVAMVTCDVTTRGSQFTCRCLLERTVQERFRAAFVCGDPREAWRSLREEYKETFYFFNFCFYFCAQRNTCVRPVRANKGGVLLQMLY